MFNMNNITVLKIGWIWTQLNSEKIMSEND
jgi:hypothetical protein